MSKYRTPARTLCFVVTLFATTSFPVRFTTAGDLDKAIDLVLRQNEAAAQTQKKVDAADDKAKDLLSEYRNVQRRIESLKQYNDQLETLVVDQRKEIARIQAEIDETSNMSREITPLMFRMIDALEEFVGLDVPFLIEQERKKRIENLRKLIKESDVSEAEKFRKVVEAYKIEISYGFDIEKYSGKLDDGRTVNFLRVGRIALVYETIDGLEVGAWDQEQKKFVKLPAEYQDPIREGMAVAAKQAPPQLFYLPIPPAQNAEVK